MLVVAILAILLAIAGPNLHELFINNRLSTTTNDLLAALSTARSEAIRRGVIVAVHRCDSVSAATGCREVSKLGEWGKGWYMFVDSDGSRSRDTRADSTEEILRVGGAVEAPMTIRAGNGIGLNHISFDSHGRLSPGGGNNRTILVICYDNKLASNKRPRSRAVMISLAGMVRMATHDADGVPLNAANRPVDSCTDPRYPLTAGVE